MERKSEFMLPFVGLKEGVHHFKYDIENTFFKAYDFNDFFDAKIKVDLTFDKKATLMNLNFKAVGSVEVACDVSNEHFDFPIDTNYDWIIKFGDDYNNDNDEILIIPHGTYQIDVAQPIYEMIVLAIPLKIIHPGIEDGTLESEILNKLEELKPKERSTSKQESDPRWNKLKDLLQ
ncbi:MAG: YceD family protein [Flavobacteriaceae bacterium]